jgi:hypothetical protein
VPSLASLAVGAAGEDSVEATATTATAIGKSLPVNGHQLSCIGVTAFTVPRKHQRWKGSPDRRLNRSRHFHSQIYKDILAPKVGYTDGQGHCEESPLLCVRNA